LIYEKIEKRENGYMIHCFLQVVKVMKKPKTY